MAINKNHEFDDLDGVKCAVVEKTVTPERVAFLKSLLELNGFTVVVVKSPPPKFTTKPVQVADPAVSNMEKSEATESVPLPETFTLGVTDVTFNATNAIFGRLLHTAEKKIVTLSYWMQKENVSNDTVPYFEVK